MRNQLSILKRTAIFYPLAFLIFIWPYSWPISFLPTLGAWRFVMATLGIVASAVVFYGKPGLWILGFPKRAHQIIACALVCAVVFLVFYFFIDFVLDYGGYQQLPFIYIPSPQNFFGNYPLLSRTLWRICQPLNEEIILRALLLGLFARFFTHRAYLAIIAALVFSGLHLLLYYFGQMNVRLDPTALLTLFFFALAANALYLTFNHIGFGFVLHMAWNWWRFSGDIVKDGIILNEAQTFNALEGSIPAFFFVTVLSLTCVFGLVIHDLRSRRMASAHNERLRHRE